MRKKLEEILGKLQAKTLGLCDIESVKELNHFMETDKVETIAKIEALYKEEYFKHLDETEKL